MTLFKFICVLYQFHCQILPIMKIGAKFNFREYVSTGTEPKGRSFKPAVNHYFSSNNVRLLAHVFTGEDPHSE